MSTEPAPTTLSASPPMPEPDSLTQFFWDGLAESELRIQRCQACQKYIHYLICSRCFGVAPARLRELLPTILQASVKGQTSRHLSSRKKKWARERNQTKMNEITPTTDRKTCTSHDILQPLWTTSEENATLFKKSIPLMQKSEQSSPSLTS